MENALIFSPSFDGHRQVHIFVMAKILKELGFNIAVAGNTEQTMSNSFYIDKLRNEDKVEFVNIGGYAEGGFNITLGQFISLQTRLKVSLTILIEADNHISLLNDQIFRKKSKLKGRVVGIFLRPFYYYRKRRLIDTLRFIKNFPFRWNNDQELFYEYSLKRFSNIDVPLSFDENFVSKHFNFKWMPDVFQKYAEEIIGCDEKSEQRLWIEKLNAFKEKNKGRFTFLYFGTVQHRRGYDILLKLAEETGGCFVHCGLRDANEELSSDIDEIILSMKNEGRFFGTNQYIEDPLCIEHFFKSATHLILPYRQYYGPSGIMLQALEHCIPILTPDSGLLGHRVKKYHLGITYSEQNKDSLKIEFERFKNMDPKIFESDIKSFMKFQSVENLKSVLKDSFVPSKKNIIQPILKKT